MITEYVKYPSTYHVPQSYWSWPDTDRSERILSSMEHFEGKEVIILEKMDGENTTMYPDYIHARSINSRHHVSRDWVKGLHGQNKHLIPEGYRVCGENMYAKHSIHYKALRSYFLGFSVWKNDLCLSWTETIHFLNDINMVHVPVLWWGIYNDKCREFLKALEEIAINSNESQMEGYVIRLMDEFYMEDFSTSIAKYVRKGHIQTEDHWMHGELIKNIVDTGD